MNGKVEWAYLHRTDGPHGTVRYVYMYGPHRAMTARWWVDFSTRTGRVVRCGPAPGRGGPIDTRTWASIAAHARFEHGRATRR